MAPSLQAVIILYYYARASVPLPDACPGATVMMFEERCLQPFLDLKESQW